MGNDSHVDDPRTHSTEDKSAAEKYSTKDKSVALSDIKIQWHPAFCAAAELEFLENKDELDFLREHNLGKKPLQIDLLVVTKRDGVRIRNEIGHIFRRYNVIEYKSPGDEMSADDFFKTVGYALLYKSQGEKADAVPLDQLTVSLVREAKPKEMFRRLKKYGFEVEKKRKGIYYVQGLFLPVQVIVTGKIGSRKHRSLKVLSKNPREEDIIAFLEEAENYAGRGDRANAEAVLQVSVTANLEKYIELMRRDPRMNEAMKILMHDQMQEAEQRGEKRGVQIGEKRGVQIGEKRGVQIGEERGEKRGEMKKARETAYELYDEDGFSLEKIAKRVKVSLETVQQWFAERPSVAK